MSIVRIILIIAVLALAYCAALLIYMIPWVCLFVAIGVLLVNAKKGYVALTSHGTARWASLEDCKAAGMVDADRGLILGRAGNTPPGIFKTARMLFDRRIKSSEACTAFVMAVRQFNRWKTDGPLIRLARSIHTAVFASTGAGKGVSIVIPFLLDSTESAVVIDPKGENYKLTADIRRKRGQKIVVIDPMKVVTDKPDSLDPLSLIDPESPAALDDCRRLADELVVTTGNEKDPHFTDSARTWIAAITALVVAHGIPGKKSLQTVRQIFADPDAMKQAIAKMCDSTAFDGMLARMGKQLTHYKDKELASTMTTVMRFLSFLDTPAIFASTNSTSFNPRELITGPMTVYLVLPAEYLREKSGLMRMWIGSFLRVCVRNGLQEKNLVHFVLDEAASLGHLDSIDDAVVLLRGYGVRLLFIYQSLGQLSKCFPDGQEHTLLGNVSKVFFAINDQHTAETVSDLLGETTIVVASGGHNTGSSRSFDQGGAGSSGQSQGSNSNWGLEARKLLKPEEVIALPQRIAITFTPGVPPIWSNLTRYYETQKQGWLKAFCRKLEIITAAVLLLGLSIGLAVKLTAAATHPHGVSNVSTLQKGKGR